MKAQVSRLLIVDDNEMNRDMLARRLSRKGYEIIVVEGARQLLQRVKDDQVDTVRFREVKQGKLQMPKSPAVLYTLNGAKDSYDPATATVKDGRPLFVVYIPFATGESLGLSAQPVVGAPWVMFPGTPKAHIMFVPKM